MLFIVLVWVSMIDEILNLRKKTSKFVCYEQYLKVYIYTWDHYFRKRCPKLDYKSTASYNDSK